jgi:hypothetical protein
VRGRQPHPEAVALRVGVVVARRRHRLMVAYGTAATGCRSGNFAE